MTSTLLWTLIAIQIVMGAFDTFYHHEMTERLAWRPSQSNELRLHSARNFLYVLLFLVLGWTEVHGYWAMLLIAVLIVEVLITLMDFVEEDMSRKFPASERVTHTLLALNYGAILVLAAAGSDRLGVAADGGQVRVLWIWSNLATIAAVGMTLLGLRDFAASRRVTRLAAVMPPHWSTVLPARQTILVTGATGLSVAGWLRVSTAAGHQVIALIRDPAKAEAWSCRSR